MRWSPWRMGSSEGQATASYFHKGWAPSSSWLESCASRGQETGQQC